MTTAAPVVAPVLLGRLGLADGGGQRVLGDLLDVRVEGW
jgi:hypothetical protein